MSAFWILVSSLTLISPAQSVDFSGPSFISVKVGDHVTLNCPFIEVNGVLDHVFWYKQILGDVPHKVAERLAYKEFKITPEFQTSGFKTETHSNRISLTIPHVTMEHGGLYYCGQFSWENVTQSRGTFLEVTDDRDVKVSVFQSSVLDSVPAGASVTLQCSVLSESRAAELQVLWFRAAPPQSHPQIIYTHHNSSHQCESGSSTHTCVYNFSKNILSLSDTGTYYCAVVLCGKIIFGNGTRVQLESSTDPGVICLAVALGVCVVVIFALIFVLTRESRICKRCKGRLKQVSVRGNTPNLDGENVEINYAALHFNGKRKQKAIVKKQQHPQDIIYSQVR